VSSLQLRQHIHASAVIRQIMRLIPRGQLVKNDDNPRASPYAMRKVMKIICQI